MANTDTVRITLRLPRDIAQDVIVRHALQAREWRQLPFDPLQPPVEIECVEDPTKTGDAIAQTLPWLLDSILRMVGDEGWSIRYDKQTAVSVASSVCAYAIESGIPIKLGAARPSKPKLIPMARLPMFLN